MGLLAQLFRHKSASPSDTTGEPRSSAPGAVGDVRGVGAIAAAAGVKTEHGMPAEFSLLLGELMARVPQHCVWPGRHDASRVVWIPAAEFAPGLARGKAELSLARLVPLVPDVFRWERGEADAPQVRLPIQKLLQQIRPEEIRPSPSLVIPSAMQACAGVAPPLAAESLSPIGFERRDVPATQPALPAHAFRENAAPAERDRASAEDGHRDRKMFAAVENPPPIVPEAKPTISITATDAPDRRVELRPSKDIAISTTLRAVVLGGISPATSANAAGSSGQILAPRVASAAPVETTPIILSPSVLPSTEARGPSPARRTAPNFAGLQSLFMSGTSLDLAGVAALATQLPGVRACVISGSAGSATAGDFSHGVSAEEVRAASADLPRIGGAAMEMLHRGESDLALFLHDDVCVAAILTGGGFVPGVHERLARVTELLAGAPTAR